MTASELTGVLPALLASRASGRYCLTDDNKQESALAHEFDIVIRNGSVADGRGTPLEAADVAVKDGRIVEVGKIAGRGIEEIDATGYVVTPGFVDIHTHYGDGVDGALLRL
jgi:imidazolonepropionase-like amidohydrolase